MDWTRMRSSLLALAAAAALAGLLLSVSSLVNRPPVILTWEAQPGHVPRGTQAFLRVAASDPDGGALRYEYSARRGRVTADDAEPRLARYTPPQDEAATDDVSVTVKDARGLMASATLSITTGGPSAPSPHTPAVAATEPAAAMAPSASTSTTVEPALAPSASASEARERGASPIETSLPTSPQRATTAGSSPRAAAVDPPAAPPQRAPAGPRYRGSSRAPAVFPVNEPAAAAPDSAPGEGVPAQSAAPEPTSAPNHPPVLEPGTTIEDLGTRSVVLVAQGYEPDGDPITHEWDTKGCFDVLNQSERSIEVKLGYCGWSTIRLTWRDPHGQSAYAEWTLAKGKTGQAQ